MTSEGRPRFTLKIGEIFKGPDEGFAAIESALEHSRKARLSNLSDALFQRLAPRIAGHQVREFYLNCDSQRDLIRQDGAVIEPVRSRWYQDFFGERVEMGEILTPTAMFHVLWTKSGEIRRIFANTDPKCIECSWKKNFMMRLEGDQLYATSYDRAEGVERIRQKAAGAAIFRACIVPPLVLHAVIPFALKADYRFILSRRDPIQKHFKKNFDVRLGSDAKIFFVYGGDEASVGSLRLDHEMYSIFWRQDQIFSIMKFENLICANCIFRVFDTAWKYSRAIGV